jgi:hypothetical protein
MLFEKASLVGYNFRSKNQQGNQEWRTTLAVMSNHPLKTITVSEFSPDRS